MVSSYVNVVSRSAWICVSSGRRGGRGVETQLPVDHVGEVSLQRAGRFAVGASLGLAAGDVGAGAWVHARLGQRHHVDRLVHAAVAGAVEPVPLALSG